MRMVIRILFSFFISNSIIPQDKELNPENYSYSIGISAGINDLHIQDKYMSSEIFRGLLFSSNLSFTAKSADNTHEAEIFFSVGEPDFMDGSWKTDEYSGYFAYSYVHHLKTFNVIGNNLNISAGGGVSSFVSSTELRRYHPASGEALFFDQSWYWSHNIDLKIRTDYSFSNHTFLLKLGIPVFKIVRRPENGHNLSAGNYEVINESFFNAAAKGKPEFFWENIVLNIQMEYSLTLSHLIDLRAGYLFTYTTSDMPDPFSLGMYMNNFLLGLAINF